VVDITDSSKVIAEVDQTSAFSTIYEGAIYMVESRQYHVDKLDVERQKAYVKRVDSDYFTDAITYTNVKVIEEFASKTHGQAIVEHGEVQVVKKVIGYKKIKFYTSENVGYGDVNLPEQEMHTTSYWFTTPKDVLMTLPYNQGDLIDGLLGVAYVIHHLAAVMLMADRRDIDQCIGDKSATWFVRHSIDGREIYSVADKPGDPSEPVRLDAFDPTLFFYDNYPGGIGFSARLYELHDRLIEGAHGLISSCPCEAGCPSCVGPINEVGATAKEVALKILELLLS
jgi:DEAD/DEAH box helicase domain-containing protein